MSDDLRVRVARAWVGVSWDNFTDYQRGVLLDDADCAIAIVWNEAHRAGFNEAVDIAASGLHEQCTGLLSRHLDLEDEHAAYCLDELSERLRRIRALRKPEEGG